MRNPTTAMLALAAIGSVHSFAATSATQTTVIKDVRLFDGELVHERATVVIKPFVIPTLTATEGAQGRDGGAMFAEDDDIGPILTDPERGMLRRKRFQHSEVKFDFTVALRSVELFHENGTTIVAGTDAPNPETMPGASVHRELELLVEAGLSPVEAQRSANSTAWSIAN